MFDSMLTEYVSVGACDTTAYLAVQVFFSIVIMLALLYVAFKLRSLCKSPGTTHRYSRVKESAGTFDTIHPDAGRMSMQPQNEFQMTSLQQRGTAP